MSYYGIIRKPLFPTLLHMLQQRGLDFPEEYAFHFLTDGDELLESITYAELDRKARAVGALLQSQGAAGLRVLLLYPPGLEYIVSFFGCLYAGAVAVPTYPPDVTRLERSLPRFLSIMKSAEPVIALTNSAILAIAQMLMMQYPEVQRIRWLATDVVEDGLSVQWNDPGVGPETLAFLQYTSGSTAEPKGVMLTHDNLMHNLEAIFQAFQLHEGQTDSAMFWLPFYHDMGLIGGILEPVYGVVSNTLMSPLDFLQHPMRWLKTISQQRVTISGGPNFAYDLCVRKATPEIKASLDLSSWTLAFNGAEPVRAETIERFAQAFAECGFRREAFYPCYGLAEASLFVSGVQRYELPVSKKVQVSGLAQDRVIEANSVDSETLNLVGCGKTWVNIEVVIVDPETRKPCPDLQVGEIWVYGPSVARGYWNQPEETELTFQTHLEGYGAEYTRDIRFLRTGDLGFLEKGELFVTGRIKDLIIIDGLNHYPQDIELTVEKSHPAIRPGCIAAFSVEKNDQEILVVVVELGRSKQLAALQQERGIVIQPAAIIAVIRDAVAQQHDLRLADVVLLKSGSIPKTSSGKIQRHACRRDYLNGSLERWDKMVV